MFSQHVRGVSDYTPNVLDGYLIDRTNRSDMGRV